MPGEVRKKVLMKELETADVIIFLVSPDSIAPDYIQAVQIKKAIERHERGDAIIVPIILRPCDFPSLVLSKFQPLPKAAKPISTWQDKDEAWLDVLQGIKTMIAGVQERRYNLHGRLMQVLG